MRVIPLARKKGAKKARVEGWKISDSSFYIEFEAECPYTRALCG
jgi:hypothetical protein